MTSKMGIIIAVVVVILLLGGGTFAYMNMSASKMPSSNTKENATQDKDSMFTSLQDAFLKNMSVECNIKDEKGHTTATYIKNGMMRVNVSGKSTPESGSIIMRDEKMYFWNDQLAMVIPFNMKDMSTNPTMVPQEGTQSAQDPQAYISMIEKYKDSCKQTSVDDNLFVVPTDVKFKDMGEMMKGVTMPSGVAMPSGAKEEYEKMMQQYSNPQ